MSAPVFYGTTGSIGGSELLAAGCFTDTVTVTGATVGMPVTVTPRTFPGNGIYWSGYVSAPDTVTVKVCTSIAATIGASVYDVAVFNAGGGGGGVTLETNGVANALQSLLNLIAGTNMTLTADGAGGVTFDAAGGGGGPTTINILSGINTIGVTYQNTGLTARYVCVSFTMQVGDFLQAEADNQVNGQALYPGIGNVKAQFFFIVLPGGFYVITNLGAGTATADSWIEWQ